MPLLRLALAALLLATPALPAPASPPTIPLTNPPADPPASPPAIVPPAPEGPAMPAFPMNRVVPKGEARGIAFFASLFPDCSVIGPIVFRTLRPPQHGRLAFEPTESFTRYAPSAPLAGCNNRKVPGTRIIYEPDEGFEGLDAFRILVINADGTGAEYEAKVSVR